jgi:hypothetical protein
VPGIAGVQDFKPFNFGVEIAETTFFASVFLKISLLYQFLCWFLTQLTHGHVLVIGHKGVLISFRILNHLP